MEEPDRLGEVCPECGTRCRVIESLPKQPLRVRKVAALEEAAHVEVSQPVLPVRGSLVGYATEEEVTRDMVVVTKDVTRILGYYEETGWVLEHTFENQEEASPEEMAERTARAWGEIILEEMDDVAQMMDEIGEPFEETGLTNAGSGTNLLKLMTDTSDPEPDYDGPFAPEAGSDQEMECLHCQEVFPESAITYEQRFGEYLWWCPTEGCDGAGVGFDIHPA